ncbi:MAG: hypothetical protein IJ454_04785, partial [Clostridia bacterium]|nr:hypothetical protein [Clostridia bacterium]
AGALQGSDPYLVNYERQDESAYYIAAASANAIGNVTISSDGAVFEDTEAVLCFPEVDLSGGKNQLHLYFGGDRYNGGGIVRLAVCESSESYDTAADRHELSLKTDADALYETDYVTTDIAEHSGKCDVYVLMPNKVFDTKIYGIMVTDDAIPGSGHDGSSISAVDFDSVYARGTSTSVGVGDGYVNNTHPGTVLFYKDVTLSEVAKYFYVVMGIGSSYADQTVNIRMNSPTATPVATYRVTASSWNDRSIKAAALSGNQELPAGTYDRYVEFTGGSTSNFFSFGFSADNPLT